MSKPVTIGLLMSFFNLVGSSACLGYTFAAKSRWYWKALWIFFIANALLGIILLP